MSNPVCINLVFIDNFFASRPITLSSDAADVAVNDESLANDAISTNSLVDEFGLELAVGIMRQGSFIQTTEDIDIGSEIRVKLLFLATTY